MSSGETGLLVDNERVWSGAVMALLGIAVIGVGVRLGLHYLSVEYYPTSKLLSHSHMHMLITSLDMS